MPAGEALDDDYVISLLKRDASSHQARYSSSGLGSLSTRKRSKDAPKPNTRFLRNIIRETDSHNAALKAKEEEESRARLQELRKGKRSREDHVDGRRVVKKRKEGERMGRWASALGVLDHGARKGQRVDRGEAEPRKRNERDQRDPVSATQPFRPTSRHQRRSPDREGAERRHDRRSVVESEHALEDGDGEEDSDDPLSAFLGPEPAPQSLARGRGATNGSSMDSRFQAGYDPKTDVDLDDADEPDDWGTSLEALRDRAKWRQQGSERLRAAGFTDEEVRNWSEGTGGEKGVEDVRWRKQGEGREWDAGKEGGGEVEARGKAEWTRKVKVNLKASK